MAASKQSSSKCRHVDKHGTRCRKNAALAGFCGNHLPQYKYPILDTSRKPRDRLQDVAIISSSLANVVKLLKVCVRYSLFDQLEQIFYELVPVTTYLVHKVGGLVELTQNASANMLMQAHLVKWYDDIDIQEIQYRIYIAFQHNHDIFYNQIIDGLRKDKHLRKLLSP